MNEAAIYALIPKVSAAIGAVGKDRKNEQQGYKFRGIEDVMNAAHKALADNGVFCVPETLEHTSEDRVTSKGNPQLRVVMKIRFRFFAPDGSYVDAVTVGEAMDSSDKATNKCMSFAFKYAVNMVFCIPYADMEEGDADSPEAGAKKTQAKRTTEAKPLPTKREPGADDGDDAPPPEPESPYITTGQCAHLHKRFREELPESRKPDSEQLLHDWLGTNGYVNAEGNPSSKMVLKADFAKVGKAIVEFAKGFKA